MYLVLAVVMAVVTIGAGVLRGIMTLLQATAGTERWGATHYGHLSGILNVPVMIATAVGAVAAVAAVTAAATSTPAPATVVPTRR